MKKNNSHNLFIGYVLLVFGFFGAHRFYYGYKLSGTIYFFTLGLFGLGILFDIFYMPILDENADRRYSTGPYNYNVTWGLLTFLGFFGVHRFYLNKWITGIIYFLTAGLFGFGLLYDFWNLNEIINEVHHDLK